MLYDKNITLSQVETS